MRNLKKLMALVLAVVMVFALASVASAVGYADITDKSDITNTDAVALLVDLGVINGIKQADGTIAYKPNDIVDRATMAKLISYVKLGDFDASLFAGTATDLTDVNTNWAEGYIKYCYSTGIISGDGAGHFFPTTTVNVVAAAKMLLVTLGYDASFQGYINDSNWAVNVMKDAQSAGLLKNLSNLKASDGLTRDNAAQMIYNALFAKTVTNNYQYDMGVKYVVSTTVGTTTLGYDTYELEKVTGVLTTNNIFAGSDTVSSTIGGHAYKIATEVTDIGKEVTGYSWKDGSTSESSSYAYPTSKNTVVAVPSNLSSTSTSSKYYQKWLDNNGLEFSDATTDRIVTIAAISANNTGTKIASSDIVSVGNYKVVNVIDNNDDGVIDVLTVMEPTVAKVTSAPKTKTDSSDKVTVYIPGVTSGYVTCVGYEGVAKSDYVMYYVVGDTTYVTECASFTGIVTGYTGTTALYVDGTSYDMSKNALVVGTTNKADSYATVLGYKYKATFWTDMNGNIVMAKESDDETAVNVAVLLGFDYSTSTVTDTTVGTARLMLADGTIKVVDVDSYKKLTGDAALGAEETTDWSATLTKDTTTYSTNYAFVTYTIDEDDGTYTLVQLDGTFKYTADDDSVYASANLGSTTITSGIAKFDTANVGNANTVFAVAKYDSDTKKLTGFTIYKGIANTPEFNATATGRVLNVDGVASLVVFTAGSVEDSGDDYSYVYIPSDTDVTYTKADKTYTYADVYVDGLKTDLTVKEAVGAGLSGLYRVVFNDDGTAYKTSTVNFGDYANKGTETGVKYSNGVVTIGTRTGGTLDYWTLATDATVVEIDPTDGTATVIDASAITKDTTDTVYVLAASASKATDKVAEAVYIVKSDSSAAVLTPTLKIDGAGSYTPATAGGDGSTAANAITLTYTETGVAKDKAIAVTVAVSDGATSAISGTNTIPAKTSASATTQVTGNVTYVVTSEDGSTVLYYKVIVDLTTGA